MTAINSDRSLTCVTCYEIIADSAQSRPIPCCFKPLCQDCAADFNQNKLSMTCGHCGQHHTTSQNTTSGQLVNQNTKATLLYLTELVAAAKTSLEAKIKPIEEALTKTLSQQRDSIYNAYKLQQRVEKIFEVRTEVAVEDPADQAHFEELMRQTFYHDKNFKITIEQNRTQLKQLRGLMEYLQLVPLSPINDFTIINTVTKLAQLQIRLKATFQPTVYPYKALQYNYHRVRSSIGSFNMVEMLKQFWAGYKAKQPPVKTLKILDRRNHQGDYNHQGLGNFKNTSFSECFCLDPTKPQPVQHSYFSQGFRVTHYHGSGDQKPLCRSYSIDDFDIRAKLTRVTDDRYTQLDPYAVNCHWAVFAWFSKQVAIDRGEPTQRLIVISLVELAELTQSTASKSRASILESTSQYPNISAILLKDKIITVTEQGLMCYWLPRFKLPAILPGRLILDQVNIFKITHGGVYLCATNSKDYTQPFRQDTRSSRGIIYLNYQITSFGQIDVESLTQLQPIRNIISRRLVVLQNGIIIFQGSSTRPDSAVSIWHNGLVYSQGTDHMVDLIESVTNKDFNITSEGYFTLTTEDLAMLEYYCVS